MTQAKAFCIIEEAFWDDPRFDLPGDLLTQMVYLRVWSIASTDHSDIVRMDRHRLMYLANRFGSKPDAVIASLRKVEASGLLTLDTIKDVLHVVFPSTIKAKYPHVKQWNGAPVKNQTEYGPNSDRIRTDIVPNSDRTILAGKSTPAEHEHEHEHERNVNKSISSLGVDDNHGDVGPESVGVCPETRKRHAVASASKNAPRVKRGEKNATAPAPEPVVASGNNGSKAVVPQRINRELYPDLVGYCRELLRTPAHYRAPLIRSAFIGMKPEYVNSVANRISNEVKLGIAAVHAAWSSETPAQCLVNYTLKQSPPDPSSEWVTQHWGEIDKRVSVCEMAEGVM